LRLDIFEPNVTSYSYRRHIGTCSQHAFNPDPNLDSEKSCRNIQALAGRQSSIIFLPNCRNGTHFSALKYSLDCVDAQWKVISYLLIVNSLTGVKSILIVTGDRTRKPGFSQIYSRIRRGEITINQEAIPPN